MENNTTTNATQITRVRFASPQAADRTLNSVDRITVGVRGAFYAPTHQGTAVKDVAHLRAWRPPV
ncbi:MAG: hypothetical protein ABIP19_11650 [Dermatophilaceae bacterium]